MWSVRAANQPMHAVHARSSCFPCLLKNTNQCSNAQPLKRHSPLHWNAADPRKSSRGAFCVLALEGENKKKIDEQHAIC